MKNSVNPDTQTERKPATADAARVEAANTSAAPRSDPSSPPAAPALRIFFRYNGLGRHYGRLAWVDRETRQHLEFASLSCEAVYVASDRGICLKADRGVFTTYSAELFDARTFQSAGTIALKGVPSRCRVAADGSLAALTVFVTGHSYASTDFSTQTLLLNAKTAAVLADLETYSVFREGQPFSNQDFNFWGVSFVPDAKEFYCTLSTNRQHFLVKGDTASRTARLIHDEVECPSLSPDGRRVAYKKRILSDGRITWRIQVLELQTGNETPLPEERTVDDQLEWLDRDQLLYTLPANDTGSSASTNVWKIAADGSRKPELFLKNAYSPTVER